VRLKPDFAAVIHVSSVSPMKVTYAQRASEEDLATLTPREQHKFTKYSMCTSLETTSMLRDAAMVFSLPVLVATVAETVFQFLSVRQDLI